MAGLGEIGAPPEHAIPAIVAVLESDESYAAARALAQFGPKAEPAIGPLTKALGYKDSFTRSSAAGALGKIGPTARSAAPALRKVLKDIDESARLQAAIAIWKVEGSASSDVIEALSELLKTEDIMNGLQAIETLGDIGPSAKWALPVLEKAHRKGENFFAAPVIWATGRIREEKNLVPRLVLELKNKEPNTRSGAAWALGKMGPEARETVPALRKLVFDDEIGFGRLFVLEALERIEGHEKATEWIESMQSHEAHEDMGENAFTFPGSAKFKARIEECKIKPEDARSLLLKRQQADMNPVRHELLFIYKEWYVFVPALRKNTFPLYGYYINGKTGVVKRVRTRDEVDVMYDKMFPLGYMTQTKFNSLRDADEK